MDVLLEPPRRHRRCAPATPIRRTVADELETNPFVRVWRGLDPEGDEQCTALGDKPATLVLWGPDYDGGHKAWVRWEDGSDDIVPGSRWSANVEGVRREPQEKSGGLSLQTLLISSLAAVAAAIVVPTFWARARCWRRRSPRSSSRSSPRR